MRARYYRLDFGSMLGFAERPPAWSLYKEGGAWAISGFVGSILGFDVVQGRFNGPLEWALSVFNGL